MHLNPKQHPQPPRAVHSWMALPLQLSCRRHRRQMLQRQSQQRQPHGQTQLKQVLLQRRSALLQVCLKSLLHPQQLLQLLLCQPQCRRHMKGQLPQTLTQQSLLLLLLLLLSLQ